MQESHENVDLNTIYQEYAAFVYRFLYSHIHDAEWAQELMQETFLRAINSISRYDGSCKLSTWLCQIAKYVLYQDLRKKKRTEMLELRENLSDQTALDGEAIVIRQESKLELYQAIHHLPELEREVVLYRITAELSFREIGAILGKARIGAGQLFTEPNKKSKRS